MDSSIERHSDREIDGQKTDAKTGKSLLQDIQLNIVQQLFWTYFESVLDLFQLRLGRGGCNSKVYFFGCFWSFIKRVEVYISHPN